MKQYLPIVISLLILVGIAYVVVDKKNTMIEKPIAGDIGTFTKKRSCVKTPAFLKKLGIPQPVMIDLSQKQYKGIALLYGQQMQKALHPKLWEKYAHFGTYALDRQGNIFLTPMPFISIEPTTFNLQKNIYKLDSQTGKLDIFMHLDDVQPSASNPFGVMSVVYDCDDDTLWVSALDESTYAEEKGVIYHIDIKTKIVIDTIKGIDALSLALLKSSKGKYLLVGSARDNVLYAYTVSSTHTLSDTKVMKKKLLELPKSTAHIRKIKIKGDNQLELQSISFSYTLIAQSAKNDREIYQVFWNPKNQKCQFKEKIALKIK